MGFSRCVVVGLASVLFTGCGYVHFGRAPQLGADAADAKLATAYSDLATEQKMLRQELALARKESDTLRTALERTGTSAAPAPDQRLAGALQELTELRASHARLQAERSTAANLAVPADAAKQLSELEQKLASATQTSGALQAEVTQLRQDLDRVRAENVALNDDLRRALQQQEEMRILLAAREAELGTVAQARQMAEQRAEAARGELQEALRAKTQPSPTSPANVVAAATSGYNAAASPLQMAKSPPAGAATSEVRAPFQAAEAPPVSNPNPPPAKSRVHVVQRGDTLEKLSRTYYGVPDQWHVIYEANMAELSTGRPLQPGMELTIPDKTP